MTKFLNCKAYNIHEVSGMSQIVYVDVLLTLNIFINFFLLMTTALITKTHANRYRILAASLIGGVYSLSLLLPVDISFLSGLLRFIFSVVIVITAFRIKNIRSFLRYWGSFFLTNFAFAGIMLGIWFALKPAGMVYSNGAIYLNVNTLTLVIGTVICYVILGLISKFTSKNAPDSHICEIEIKIFNKTVRLKSLIDTGNSLKDCFTGEPVAVVEETYIRDIFPDEIKNFVRNKKIPENEEYIKMVRLIPCSTVNGEGVLASVRSESIRIFYKNEIYISENPFVAVSGNPISLGEYFAVIGPDLLEASEKHEKLSCDKSKKAF